MIKRIAIIYDDSYKWTTAFYCKRALEKLGYLVDHFLPDDVDSITPTYDLYLNVDENKRYLLPMHLRPSAYWVIDTHTDYDWRLRKAKMFNFVFVVHKSYVERLKKDGVRNVYWLSVACDPDIHRDYNLPKEYDVAFVGHYHHSQDRIEYLNFLKKKLRNYRLFIGQAYGEEMSRIYSKSKIVFNRSLKSDVTMRIFEAMACGGLLITDDISHNGGRDLFGNEYPFIVYHSKRDLIKRIKYYLRNEDEREKIATQGKDEVVHKHTYLHRMQELINIVEANKTNLKHDGEPMDDLSALGDIYPVIFNLIGDKEKVLDIGCATARFSKNLVSKKRCFVTGIEKDPLLAQKARRVLSEVIEGDATSCETFHKINHKYDSVLLMDILEHVVNPELILLGVRRFIDKQSKIILTTPNIANWAFRKELLMGRFNYEPQGGVPMDNEHVHFFTYYSLKDMIEDTGYKIKDFDMLYSFPLIKCNHPNIFIKKIMHAIAKKFPNFFAHKFLFILEKD